MRHRNLNIMLWSGCLGLWMAPAWGHQVKITEDVGATIHFEPRDRPQSLTPNQVWFALTKKGGTAIPLKDCNCQLKVGPFPGESTARILDLVAINAENYREIPSATVTFPTAGIYGLELTGKPLKAGDFKPFRLYFESMVIAGPASPLTSLAIPSPQAAEKVETGGEQQPQNKTSSFNVFYWVCGVGIVSGFVLFRRRN
jgi:hypothetical protein